MMTDNDITPDSPEYSEEDVDMKFGAKLAAVVLDPRRVFRAVAARPQFVAPMAILMGAALLFAILTRPIILQEVESGDRIEQLIEKQNLSEAEAERAMEIQKGMAKIGIFVLAPLGEVFSCVIFAAILLFVGNVILGGTASYVGILSGYAWAKLITLLGYAAKIPLVLTTGTIQVTLSPAILLPGSASDSLLYTVLSVFDVFHIWEAILTCFAMAAVYKMSLQRAVGFVGTVYVVLSAVGIILKELFGTGGV